MRKRRIDMLDGTIGVVIRQFPARRGMFVVLGKSFAHSAQGESAAKQSDPSPKGDAPRMRPF